MVQKVRLDKFLWAVRLFKKRQDAAAACTKGHILVNGNTAKPSKHVNINDIISVKNNVIFRQYQVINTLQKRIGAKLVKDYIIEITPEKDLLKLKIYYEFQKSYNFRQKSGRPTKKDRRDLNNFLENGFLM